MGDFSHLKNKKGELVAQPLPQPTLPNLSVDDDIDHTSKRGQPPSTYTQIIITGRNTVGQDWSKNNRFWLWAPDSKATAQVTRYKIPYDSIFFLKQHTPTG